MKKHILAGIAAIALSGCNSPEEYTCSSFAAHDRRNCTVSEPARSEPAYTDKFYKKKVKESAEETYRTTIRGVTVELYEELGKITPQEGYTEITGIKKIVYDRKGRYADCIFDKEKGGIMLYNNGDISVSGAKIRLKLSEKDNKKLEQKISLFGK